MCLVCGDADAACVYFFIFDLLFFYLDMLTRGFPPLSLLAFSFLGPPGLTRAADHKIATWVWGCHAKALRKAPRFDTHGKKALVFSSGVLCVPSRFLVV